MLAFRSAQTPRSHRSHCPPSRLARRAAPLPSAGQSGSAGRQVEVSMRQLARGAIRSARMPETPAAVAALKEAVSARFSAPSRLFGALNGSVQEIQTGPLRAGRGGAGRGGAGWGGAG